MRYRFSAKSQNAQNQVFVGYPEFKYAIYFCEKLLCGKIQFGVFILDASFASRRKIGVRAMKYRLGVK